MELRHLDPFLLLDEFVGRSSFLLWFSYYFIYFLLEYTKFHKVIPLVGSAVTVSVGFLEHPHRVLVLSRFGGMISKFPIHLSKCVYVGFGLLMTEVVVFFGLHRALTHQDFAGNKGTINTGDVQWMTAGRGIVHSDMLVSEGINRGLYLWINLASNNKM
ncbi:hypothetical protein NE237_019029 [Protea cynaroides]|uniref:Pirin N-terminal domain-containing protein n=1 Tax=Protea cynaroides TaxID=273540 RepID=A0A9Q0QPH1_9MAGN|nr:hypothetical protein NE237_019029 [Protea cynaroides]